MSFFERISEEFDDFYQELLMKLEDFFHEDKAVKLGVILLILVGLIVGAYIGLSGIASAPQKGFEIRVVDENGNPVDGAFVKVYDNGKLVGANTTVNGIAHFDGLERKQYTYSVFRDGYAEAAGTYDPNKPGKNVVQLKENETSTTSPIPSLTSSPAPAAGPTPSPTPATCGFGGNCYLPQSGTLSCPSGKTKITGTCSANKLCCKTPSSAPSPTPPPYANLHISVKDKETNASVVGATVTMKDAATQTLVLTSQTNAQGVLDASVARGSKLLVQSQAAGYAPSEPKTVTVSSASVSVEILLLSESSDQTAKSVITVYKVGEQPLSNARVQVFSSPPVIDQLTTSDGQVFVYLEKSKQYNVLATKDGYGDNSKQFVAGENVLLLLNEKGDGPTASLLVTTVFSDESVAGNSAVAVLKKSGTDYLPYVSQTASAAGTASFIGLDLGEVRVSATSSDGIYSASKDVVLAEGVNNVKLAFETVHKPDCADGGGTCMSKPCSAGLIPVQAACPSVASACCMQSGSTMHVSKNIRVRKEQMFGWNSAFTFKDVSVSNLAGFEVKAPTAQAAATSVICNLHDPACTYAVGPATQENAGLASLTGFDVSLAALDTATPYADVIVNWSCPSTGCVCPSGSPVCGSDGTTYSACEATSAGVAYTDGTCPCPETREPVCGYDGKTYDNSCWAKSAGANYVDGECPACPGGTLVEGKCVCPPSVEPVCGSDGKTYQNVCGAGLAGITKYTPGECPACPGGSVVDGKCICSDSYEPICWKGCKSYANLCNAVLSGVATYTEGACMRTATPTPTSKQTPSNTCQSAGGACINQLINYYVEPCTTYGGHYDGTKSCEGAYYSCCIGLSASSPTPTPTPFPPGTLDCVQKGYECHSIKCPDGYTQKGYDCYGGRLTFVPISCCASPSASPTPTATPTPTPCGDGGTCAYGPLIECLVAPCPGPSCSAGQTQIKGACPMKNAWSAAVCCKSSTTTPTPSPMACTSVSASTPSGCVAEGGSLGAVVPGNTLQCCDGLQGYTPDGLVGSRGTCWRKLTPGGVGTCAGNYVASLKSLAQQPCPTLTTLPCSATRPYEYTFEVYTQAGALAGTLSGVSSVSSGFSPSTSSNAGGLTITPKGVNGGANPTSMSVSISGQSSSCPGGMLAGDKCVCPTLYAPVCGADCITYPNACAAQVAGITEYVAGECSPAEPTPTPTPTPSPTPVCTPYTEYTCAAQTTGACTATTQKVPQPGNNNLLSTYYVLVTTCAASPPSGFVTSSAGSCKCNCLNPLNLMTCMDGPWSLSHMEGYPLTYPIAINPLITGPDVCTHACVDTASPFGGPMIKCATLETKSNEQTTCSGTPATYQSTATYTSTSGCRSGDVVVSTAQKQNCK